MYLLVSGHAESGSVLHAGRKSLTVGLEDTDESCDFEFKLSIDRCRVVECIQAPDGFKSAGGQGDFCCAEVPSRAFERVCHSFNGGGIGGRQCGADVSEHVGVPIKEQADELPEEFSVPTNIIVHLHRIEDSIGEVAYGRGGLLFVRGRVGQSSGCPPSKGRS